MTDRVGNRKLFKISLLRSALLLGVLAFPLLLTSCGGGGTAQPPITPAASLGGIVTFTSSVPLGSPPGHGQSSDVRYAARIIDPGDDIGSVPIPKPSTLGSTGNYEFKKLDPNPLSYFNLLFTVDADLQGDGASDHTPVGFNIPVSLADGISSLLSVAIDKPFATVLEMTYTYSGPDGTRVVRLRLDFATDLLTFDLDADGMFDDLVAVDADHDSIPDNLAKLMPSLDYRQSFQTVGTVTALGGDTIGLAGKTFQMMGFTDISNAATGTALSLSELAVGGKATVYGVVWDSKNLAVKLEIQPDPASPQPAIEVHREGTTEQMDATTIFVGGTLFHDYAQAKITNQLGDSVPSSEIKVGVYATVDGVRDGTTVTARAIQIKEIAPPPANFQRSGTIQSLDPSDNPTTMQLDGMTFELPDTTVIRDIDGQSLDKTYLHVGSPALVYAHQAGGSFIADIVELQFKVDKTGIKQVEVVVLYNDPSALPEIQAAIDQIKPSVPVAPVLIAHDPPAPTDPECLGDVFGDLYLWTYLLHSVPGLVEAYPRVEDGNCEVLAIIENGFVDTPKWIDVLFPKGLGGAPFKYDRVALPPFYGVGSDYSAAEQIVNRLDTKLATNKSVVMKYISPDKDF